MEDSRVSPVAIRQRRVLVHESIPKVEHDISVRRLHFSVREACQF